MQQRLISAAVLVPVVLIIFAAGFPWIGFGIAALGVAGAYEAARLARGAGLPADAAFAVVGTLVATIGILFALSGTRSFFEPWPEMWTLLVLGYFAAVVMLGAVSGFLERDPKRGFARWGGNVIATLYPSLIAFLIALAMVNPGLPESSSLPAWLDAGRMWLLVLLLTVWSLDTFAYVAGKYHGRGRFMNHISPNKTWSGVVGGTAAALLVCTLLVWVAGQQPLAGVVLGIVIAVAAQAGDLAESLFKRAAGAKDSGSIMPGHGGILDRIDSFLFAGPAMFLTLAIGMSVLR